MADSNRTGQRLLDSIRKAKAGDETTGDTPAPAPESRPKSVGASARRSPAPAPAPATTPTAAAAPARKATAPKATVKTAPAQRAAADTAPGRKPPARRKVTAASGRAGRGATTAAPPTPFTTRRPQPAAYPGERTDADPYRSPGRVWPD